MYKLLLALLIAISTNGLAEEMEPNTEIDSPKNFVSFNPWSSMWVEIIQINNQNVFTPRDFLWKTDQSIVILRKWYLLWICIF